MNWLKRVFLKLTGQFYEPGKLFHCKICGKGFNDLDEAKEHFKKYHPEEYARDLWFWEGKK